MNNNNIYPIGINRGIVVNTNKKYALSFDGNTNNIDIPGTAANITGAKTMEMWIKYPTIQLSGRSPIQDISVNAHSGWGFYSFTAGKLAGIYGTTASYQITSECSLIPTDWWLHIATSYNGTNIKIYRNGIIQGSPVAHAPDDPANTRNMMIGGFSNPTAMTNCIINDIRIYNREIESTEIIEHMNGVFSNNTGLIINYTMEEGKGTILNDQTGNGNTGTINGATWIELPNNHYNPESLYGSSYWTQLDLKSFSAAAVNNNDLINGCFSTDTSGVGSYLKIDVGAALTKEFRGVSITISGDIPATWDVEYSDDSTTWNKCYIGANLSGYTGLTTVKLDWNSVGPHRYWRLYKTDIAGGGHWYNEVQFRLNPS